MILSDILKKLLEQGPDIFIDDVVKPKKNNLRLSNDMTRIKKDMENVFKESRFNSKGG